MRVFLLIFLCLLTIGSTVPNITNWKDGKSGPDHIGIDQEFQGFKDMYVSEAMARGIKFTRPISIGFSKIGNDKTKDHPIGLCSYGYRWREIDIDVDYWNKSTWITKRSLLYHEMTHCFCEREHDWKDGVYPEVDSALGALRERYTEPFWKLPPGFMDDGCPASIMYPRVLSDECAQKHWPYYDNEMFEYCRPY